MVTMLPTLNPAIQLGIEEQVGSLHPGKAADFAIYSGHPFDTTSKVLMTFVDGEMVGARKNCAILMHERTGKAKDDFPFAEIFVAELSTVEQPRHSQVGSGYVS